MIKIKIRGDTLRAIPYLLPILIAIAFVSVYPFVNGIIKSLYTDQVFGTGTYFSGWENFQEVFADNLFWVGLKNNLVWSFSCVGLELVIGMLIALVLNLPYIKFRSIHRALILLPWATTPVVAALIWRYIFGVMGPLNEMLRAIGIANPPGWLITPGYSLAACIVANIWIGLPFVVVIILAGLQSLPTEAYEAAAIDGAGPIRRFFFLTIPLMKSLLLILMTLTTIWTFNMFDIVFSMTNGGPGNSSLLLSLYAYQNAFAYYQQGYASAIGVICLAILLIPVAFYIKEVRSEN